MKAELILEIPDEINRRLATGEYERIGGVVREKKQVKSCFGSVKLLLEK